MDSNSKRRGRSLSSPPHCEERITGEELTPVAAAIKNTYKGKKIIDELLKNGL